MILAWLSIALAAPTEVVYYDHLPSTLLPIYAADEADTRASELVFDRIYYASSIT